MGKRDLRPLLPPGPTTPSVIQLVATWTRPAGSLDRLRRRYGRRFTVQLPFQPPFVMISDPDEIKELFKRRPTSSIPARARACSSRSSAATR